MEELVQTIEQEVATEVAEDLMENAAEAAKSGNIVVAAAAVGGFVAGAVVTKLLPKAVKFGKELCDRVKAKREAKKPVKDEAKEPIEADFEEVTEETEE